MDFISRYLCCSQITTVHSSYLSLQWATYVFGFLGISGRHWVQCLDSSSIPDKQREREGGGHGKGHGDELRRTQTEAPNYAEAQI